MAPFEVPLLFGRANAGPSASACIHLPAPRTWLARCTSSANGRGETGASWIAQRAGETRRSSRVRLQFKDATYVSLCVLNVNAAADSDKYISLGLWLEAQRVVTARRQHIGTIDEVKRELQEGDGPAARWDFLALVARQLTDQLEDCVIGLGVEVDTLEEQVLQKGRKLPIDESAAVGRRLLGVRRYLAPLAELLNYISTDHVLKISQDNREALREAADHVAYYVRNTDLALDRARLTQQQIQSRLAARMDQITQPTS